MREETYNYAFLMKIYEGSDDDSHETAYWACWRVIRCDPDSGMVYLKPDDASGRIDLGKKYLFCEFSYIPEAGPGEYTVNYTNIKPYPLAERGEVYDPPDRIKLCAKYNATVYRKARNKWDQLKEEAKQDPVSSRLSNLIAYHQRIVADCQEWFRLNCPEYIAYIEPRSITQFPVKPGTQWRDVKITFITPSKIKITAKGMSGTYHFKKIGLSGRNPNEAGSLWELLLRFADKGVLDKTIPTSSDRKTELKSQISNLRKRLRKILPIEGDPIPFNPSEYGGEYSPRFEINHKLKDSRTDPYMHYDDEED